MQRTRLPFVVLLVALFQATSPANARDIYVDNATGNDRNIGTSPTNSSLGGGPCRTIARALQVAGESDRIVIANTGEPYRESLTLFGLHNSGTSAKPFVLIGNGAVLDGSVPVDPRGWQFAEGDVYRLVPARTSYQQLFLDDIPLPRVHVDNNEMRLPKLRPFHWCLFDGAMYINMQQPTEADLAWVNDAGDEHLHEIYTQKPWRYSPGQYNFSFAGLPVGITVYDARNVVIADLFVQGYQLDGINCHDKAFSVELLGITARGNGRSGISIGGASRVKIADSAARFNGTAQIRTEGYSHTMITGCDILGEMAPTLVREGGDVTIDGLEVDQPVLKGDILPPPPQEVPK